MAASSRQPLFTPVFALLALLLSISGVCADIERRDGQTFLSRPDIRAPSWNITIHEQASLSPGYWFLAPYIDESQDSMSHEHPVAPMIFDQSGGLIYSGTALTKGHNASDFRVSNVLGQDRLTFLHPENRSLVVLNADFTIFKQLEVSPAESSEIYNMHELNFVSGGSRALFFYDKDTNLTERQSAKFGYDDGRCYIRESTFRESDLLEDWRYVYRWSASKRIDMTESTATAGTLADRCNNTDHLAWDWVQPNAVDKFDHEGDYLLSARHTDTVYKILRDGDIAWRLGGEESDFQADFTFSRQNHARILSYNGTETIISLFDNAGSGSESAQSSRGMIISLQTATEPKTATLLATYNHPDGPGSYLSDDGSVQALPDGNVFLGWSEGLLISEHDADGRLLMSARAEEKSLKSYRSYKFPFVGRPAGPPDVYAEVGLDGSGQTSVYASWNGATEVAGWHVYQSNHLGKLTSSAPMANAARTGFETKIETTGVVGFVVVEALDESGKALGRSDAFPVVGATPTEEDLKDEPPKDPSSWKEKATSRNGIASFFGLLFLIAVAVLAIRYWRRRRPSWASKHNRKLSNHEMTDRREEIYSLDDDEDDDHGYK